jgi:hypothetical protein
VPRTPEPPLYPGRFIYFMVFATDHPAGLRIITDDFQKVPATAVQTTFLPYNERY